MELQQDQATKLPLSDEKIIALYWSRDEQAIEETDFKYKNYLFTIAYNIVHGSADCEECLNDTYLGTWNAIPPSKPNFLKAFLTVIMRRAAIKRYHANTKKGAVESELTVSLSELEDFISGDGDVDSEFDAAHLGTVLSDFVRALPSRRQFIFISRYYVANPIDTIASELSVSRSTVNKELAAIRQALKEKLESEGFLYEKIRVE
jgi:RNA polymerase sigma-70 factor (ECF subfamily)